MTTMNIASANRSVEGDPRVVARLRHNRLEELDLADKMAEAELFGVIPESITEDGLLLSDADRNDLLDMGILVD